MSKAPYDSVALEYYGEKHKTSRNFDETSLRALQDLRIRIPASGLVLDIGSGRGRTREFLDIDSKRVIQLDNSSRMLQVLPREECLLRIIHDAEHLPFLDGEFSCVTSFLCDPFFGLTFLNEAFRVLTPGGLFVATTPSYEWGAALRSDLGIDVSTTRFITEKGPVITPSNLVPRLQLLAMLERVGFSSSHVTSHCLPEGTSQISPDITKPATLLDRSVNDREIIYLVVANKQK